MTRHREFHQRSPIPFDSIVEYAELSDEVENEKEVEIEPIDLGEKTFDEWFRLKSENNRLLQNTVSKLNKRIGTEIVDTDSDEDSNGCYVVPRYKIPEDTKNLQRDFNFVPKLLFRTKVKKIHE